MIRFGSPDVKATIFTATTKTKKKEYFREIQSSALEPDDVLIVMTEGSTNLTGLIGRTTIFTFDFFRSYIEQTNARIIGSD